MRKRETTRTASTRTRTRSTTQLILNLLWEAVGPADIDKCTGEPSRPFPLDGWLNTKSSAALIMGLRSRPDAAHRGDSFKSQTQATTQSKVFIMANAAQRTQIEMFQGVQTTDIELSYLNLVLDILGAYYSGGPGDIITQNYIQETVRRIEACASRNSTAAVNHVKTTLNRRGEQLGPRI